MYHPAQQSSLLYDATERCRDALGGCASTARLMKGQWAENRLADFNLWAAGVGASTSGPACLDSRLSSDEVARHAVFGLLSSLEGHIRECERLGTLSPRHSNGKTL